MLKKLLSCVLAVAMVFTITSTCVFAQTDEEKGISEVEKANEKVEKTVEKVLEKEDVSDAEIQKLIDKTDKAAEKGIEKAERNGVEAECEYEEYEINGQTVLIDPLRVIRA